MEEITAFPAKRDCLNSLTIWDRGLVEPFVYDCVRTSQTMTLPLWYEYHKRFQEALGKTRSIYFIALHPFANVDAKDEQDKEYQAFEETIRQRFLTAAEYLTIWGDEVHIIDNFQDPVPGNILRSYFTNHQVIGINHRIENGRVILGDMI